MKLELWIYAVVTLCLSPSGLQSAQLTGPADRAFQRYVDQVEQRLATQHSRKAYAELIETGGPHGCTQICIEPVRGGTWEADGALLHHWRGGMLVPRATAAEMLALLGDYADFSTYYAPEIEWANAEETSGPHAVVRMRLKEQKPISVVLDATYVVESALSASDRGYSVSRSARIQEVENAGTSRERKLPPGDDDGFLWKLNSYWTFVEVPGGLFIECEAVSLTRDIPAGLGWLITPLLQSFSRDSLSFTLEASARALAVRARDASARALAGRTREAGR